MTPPMSRYDSLLPGIDSNSLKKRVTLWGGRSKLSKDDCIRWIRQGLTDPQEIDAAIARMQRHERAVLGLMKLLGGIQDFRALTVALKVTGTLPVERPDVQTSTKIVPLRH